jgi:hypothetical protein
MMSLTAETGAVMVSAYLEILGEFSDQDLAAATDKIRRKSGNFPPSAGDIYDACKNLYKKQAMR